MMPPYVMTRSSVPRAFANVNRSTAAPSGARPNGARRGIAVVARGSPTLTAACSRSRTLPRGHEHGNAARHRRAEARRAVGVPPELLHANHPVVPARRGLRLRVVHDPLLRAVGRRREAGVPHAVNARV